MSVAAEVVDEATSIEVGDLARLTVDQYEELARLDVISDPRIELVNGLLVRKMTKKPRHSYSIEVIDQFLRSVAPVGWYVRVEQPVRLPEHDEPEPDLAVVRGKVGDFLDRHPGPADVALVVEVSQSSLRLDRGDKLRAYARAGIPVYWIVNLVDRQIEVHHNPSPAGYDERTVHDASSHVPFLLDGSDRGRIAVALILPE